MKIALAALTSVAFVNGCSFDGDDTFQTTSGCNFASVATATGCTAGELQGKLGANSEEEATNIIRTLCNDALSSTEVDEYGYVGFPFERVMAKGYIWDQNFFNGGTAYNTNESDDIIADQGIRIQAVKDNIVGSQIIDFPDARIPNFQNCELNAAMCCYVSKKTTQATDTDPEAKSDICYHDMSRSQRAARTKAGYAYFGKHEDEGNSYCEAFAWDDEFDGPYKGNALFHVAMDTAFLKNKSTRSVPGAPMCACLEQMPVVSDVACTKTQVTQTFKVKEHGDGSRSLEATNHDITFSDCGDFSEHYAATFPQSSISDYIVETCPDTPPFLESLGYVPRETSWVPIYGKGKLHYARMDSSEVREKMNGGLNIIKRRCLDCHETHVNVYYKRLTPVPDDLDMMDLLLDYWNDPAGNEFNVDFKLYSSYADAVEDRSPWKYCNFMDKGIGFPRDCGPDRAVGGQWNSLYRGGKQDVLFSIGN